MFEDLEKVLASLRESPKEKQIKKIEVPTSIPCVHSVKICADENYKRYWISCEKCHISTPICVSLEDALAHWAMIRRKEKEMIF